MHKEEVWVKYSFGDEEQWSKEPVRKTRSPPITFPTYQAYSAYLPIAPAKPVLVYESWQIRSITCISVSNNRNRIAVEGWWRRERERISIQSRLRGSILGPLFPLNTPLLGSSSPTVKGLTVHSITRLPVSSVTGDMLSLLKPESLSRGLFLCWGWLFKGGVLFVLDMQQIFYFPFLVVHSLQIQCYSTSWKVSKYQRYLGVWKLKPDGLAH